jgi:N-acetyl-anhydromuramyl-L-alanine amidase AmpD
VKLIQWLRALSGASQNGPAPTSLKSSLPSSASSTTGQSIKPKPNAPRFKEKLLNTPNVSAGRRIKPQAVVLHHTAGSYAGSVAWCMDPASKVSYHIIVAKDGRRTVLADPDERTWHAGVSSWRGKRDLNSWAIGAAFEGDTNTRQLGEAEMASMAEYLLPLMKRYGLTLADVTDHRTVSPGRKDDLAPSELARFKEYLSKRIQSAE